MNLEGMGENFNRNDPAIFNKIQFLLGVNDTVNLFASKVNDQLAHYVAWNPDPGAWKIDAFSVNWTYFSGYCFPPFCLITRVLQRIELLGAEYTLVAPFWTTQAWHTKL